MTCDEFREPVLGSAPSDWQCDEDFGGTKRWLLKSDLDICFKRDPEPDNLLGDPDRFGTYPDNKKLPWRFVAYYRTQPIMTFTLVAVDGMRAFLPIPNAGTKDVAQDEYQFAKLVNRGNALDEYMRRAEFQMEGS